MTTAAQREKTVKVETDATDDPALPFIAWPVGSEGPICGGMNRGEAARRLGKALGATEAVYVVGGLTYHVIV